MSVRLPPGAYAVTRPFWEAAARGVLVRPVCDRCGRNFFIPQLACPACHGEAWSYRESSGRGMVSTFSVVHRAPTPDHAPPYVVAIVDFEEGWSMMTNIVECDPGSVHIGQQVQVTFRERQDGVVLPVFRPAHGGQA